MKDHVSVDAEPQRAILEHQAIGLALTFDDVRVRRAEDDVYRVGIVREDRRQSLDDVFDALVGREQAERQNQRPSLDAEAILAPGERYVWDSVRDDVDLLLG